MGKTLFITDLDGTLLDNDQKISDSSLTLINHAIARGALFSVATARTPATVSRIMRGVDMRLPMVVMTGAALWDMGTGLYSEVQNFKPGEVTRIIDAYTQAGSGAFLYTLKRNNPLDAKDVRGGVRPDLAPASKGAIEIYHFGEMTEMEKRFMLERIDNPYKRFYVDEKGGSKLPDNIDNAVLFFGIRPDREGMMAYDNIRGIKGINPMYYHDWFGPEVAEVEAFPAGATKALAIKRLAKLAGADRIMVFGDNRNDLSMMAVADWAVAVENALDEVKEAADEVIGSNDSDAVARKILEEINR